MKPFGLWRSFHQYIVSRQLKLVNKVDTYTTGLASFVGLPRHWKLAFILDRDSNYSPEFIQIVMRNAAYKFNIFEDECKAVDWLKGEKYR